jgi:O-antigen ligase
MKLGFLKSQRALRIRDFYMGDIYPALICLMALVGNITGLEYYINLVQTVLILGAFILCDSIKPILISLCTYVYQISLIHSPCHPNHSDYYLSGWRLPVSIIIISLTALGFVLFFIKNKLWQRISPKKTPLFYELSVLSLAFLLSGAFSDKWVGKNLTFAIINIAVWFVLFLFIYHGLEEDSTEECIRYFCYIALLIALVLIGEMVFLFATSDAIFAGGAIDKESVLLGWGIWNLIGVSLSVLIPVLFYGVQNNKYPWLYFAVATLTFITAVLTMSRNALVFATLAYGASVLIGCFVGKHKKAFRIITALGILAVIAFAIVFWDKISNLLGDYFERGFSDNGRYNLWMLAFDNFKSSPVFGNGFYGFDVETAVFGPLPKQAHNTVFQLLSATGVVGLLAYGAYRIRSAIPFFRRPNMMKTYFGASILVLLGGSLLDNFIFNVYPMFFYLIALAIVFKSDRGAGK